MKNRITKIVVAALALLLMVVNTAEAAFRVKKPSSAVRQQALMSLQSVGTSENETVETTTKEKPFTVDFAALGVENPTNAYLLIVNEQTGNAITIESAGFTDKKIELPPLALAELEMQYLGANQRYRCMAMCATESGNDEILGLNLLGSSVANVKFPNFQYREDNGVVKKTTVGERKLVGFGISKPSYILSNPDDLDAQVRAEALSEENAYYVYEYELPDGVLMTYDEEEIEASETVSFQSANLTFNVSYSSGTPTAAKTATAYALNIWSSALSGTVPVTLSITFTDLSIYGDGILGCSYSPRAGLVNGVYYPESILSQKKGFDCSSSSDIRLEFNTKYSWYYGTDKNPGLYVDFVTVLLHEVCHGLGFYDSIISSSGGYGYGSGSYPLIYDTLLYYNGSRFTNLSASSRKKAIVSNALYFDGSNAKSANGGSRIKLFAPSTYMGGSSVSHWDTSVPFKNSTFMRYAYGGYPFHQISSIKKNAMKDLGWVLADSTPLKPSVPTGVSATKGTVLGQVDVTWNAVNGATSYTVYRSESASGSYSAVKTGLTTCKYSDTSVLGTAHYYYKVAAVNSAGTGSQSSYDYGYAKEEAVLRALEIGGPSTLKAGSSTDYVCRAYYSDGSSESVKDVSKDSRCEWSLPYGSSYATLSGRHLTAGYITEQKAVTVRATFGGRTAEMTVTILPKTVTVSFDQGNYGTASFSSRTYTVDETYGTLPSVSNITRGYEFLGWYTAANGGSKITETSIVSGATGKLYAHYGKVTVVTSVRIDAPSTIDCGSSYTVYCYAKDSDGVERKITSAGSVQWTVKGSGISYSSSNGALILRPSASETGTIQVMATVDTISSSMMTVTSVNPTKVITLKADGGSVSPSSISQKQGNAFSNLPTPTRSGYTFLGWYTAVSSGTKIVNGTVYDGTYTILYAHWEYIVVLSSITINGTASITSGETSTFTCAANYNNGSSEEDVSASWSVSGGGSITSDGIYTAPVVTANKSVTITASYTSKGATKTATKSVTVTPKKVIVSFNANGGTVSSTSRQFTVGLAYGTLPTPVWSGYDFKGWYTASVGGTQVTSSSIASESITIFYARWEKIVVLSSISVSGPSSVVSGGKTAFACAANFSDGSSMGSVSATWSVSAGSITSGGVYTAPTVTANKSVTITASYTSKGVTKTAKKSVTVTPKKVTVSFDANGGAVSPSSQEFTVGLTYGNLPTPTRSGWDFNGWFTAATGGLNISASSKVLENVTVLFARWEKTLSSISISGASSIVSGAKSTYVCNALYTDNSTAQGVSAAWTASDGSIVSSTGVFTAPKVTADKSVTVTASYTSKGVTKTATKSVTVTPKKVTVSFDANGGSVSPSSREFTIGLAFGNLPMPIRGGYEFEGWFTSRTGGTKVIASTVVTDGINTIFARWQKSVVLSSVALNGTASIVSGGTATFTCTAKFSDGAVMSDAPATWSVSVGTITSGGVYTAPTVTVDKSVTITVSYTSKDVTKTATKSVTITPKKVTVSFKANGGAVSPASQQFTVGLTYGNLPTPTRSGWDFKGWFTAATGGVLVSTSTMVQEDITVLFARWEKTLSSISITGPDSVVSGSTNGYVCAALFTDGSKTEEVSAIWSVTDGAVNDVGIYFAPAVTVAKSVTITASYTAKNVTKTAAKTVTIVPKKVKVSFNANGGAVSPVSKEFTVGLTYGTLPTPVRDGYVFDGWFTALNETGIPVNASSSVLDGVTTLYAKWHEAVVLRGLTVQGSSSVVSGKTVAYSCVANYSDGTTAIVAPEWSITSGGTYATMTAGGVLSAKDTTVSRTVVIRAVFGGFSATLNVVIRPRTVSVEFNGNGGIVSESTRSYVVGAKYDSLPTATRTSYRFLGWYTAASGGTRIFENTTVVESVTTLHAQWQENPPALKEIYITSENTGDTILSGSSLGLTCMAVFTNGIATTTSSLNGSDVTWSTSDVSTGTVEAGGVFRAGRVTSYSVVIVTADYQGLTSPGYAISVEPERIDVAFDANGGTVSENSREYVVGAAYGELPVPTFNDDYRFDGWFTAADGGMRVTEATVCEKSVVRLYAHWVEVTKLVDLVITCDNVITSSVPAKFVCYGVYSDDSEIVVNPEWILSDPELGTINADGIYTAEYVPEETNIVVKATVGGITGAVEVVVHPMESSIRFDPCDGAVSPQRMTFTVGAAYGELPIPVRSRYDFEGWYTRPSKMGDLVAKDSMVEPEVKTLYAGWTPTPRALSGIKIEGVESVTSGGSAVFSCKAIYSDGTEGSIVPTWSIVKGLDYGSLMMSGYFMAVEVSSAKTVTIQAVYTDKGIRYEDQHQVSIIPSALVVDPGVISIEADATKCSLLVDAYGNWDVSADVDWITLGKTSGSGIDTVPFSVAANTGSEERIGTISVRCGDLVENCVVKQYSPIPDEYVTVTLDTRIPDQPVSTRQYVKGRKFSYLPTPVRAGYAFGGWWTKPYGAGKRIHAMTIVSDDVLTLYGHWTDVSVAYALNNALDWVDDTSKPWVFDYTEAKDRKVSMTTPALGNSQKSSLTALVEGAGTLSFYWKTSSEEFFDVLALYVDGKFVSSISGETGWRTFSVDVFGHGQHVITWLYSKDGQSASGMDCAWLDMVTWMPDYAGNGASSIQSTDGRSVPETWLNSFGLDTATSVVDEDADGDGMTNYEEYIAGTDPLDQESNFRISIEMTSDGRPIIEAIPDLGDSAMRTYIFEGKETLTDKEWSEANESLHRFFRVRIEVK